MWNFLVSTFIQHAGFLPSFYFGIGIGFSLIGIGKLTGRLCYYIFHGKKNDPSTDPQSDIEADSVLA